MAKFLPNPATALGVLAALFLSAPCLASIGDQEVSDNSDAEDSCSPDPCHGQEVLQVAGLEFVPKYYQSSMIKEIRSVFGDSTIMAWVPQVASIKPVEGDQLPASFCRSARKIAQRFFALMEHPDQFHKLKALEFRLFRLFHSQPMFRTDVKDKGDGKEEEKKKDKKIATSSLVNAAAVMFPHIDEADWPGKASGLIAFHSHTAYVSLLTLYHSIMSKSSQGKSRAQVKILGPSQEDHALLHSNRDAFTQILVAIFRVCPESFANIRRLSRTLYAANPLTTIYPVVGTVRLARYARLSCGGSAQFQKCAMSRLGIFSCVPKGQHDKLLRVLVTVHADGPHIAVFQYRYALLRTKAQVVQFLEASEDQGEQARGLLAAFAKHSKARDFDKFNCQYQDAINALIEYMCEHSLFTQKSFTTLITMLTRMQLYTTKEFMDEVEAFKQHRQTLPEILQKLPSHQPILGLPRILVGAMLD